MSFHNQLYLFLHKSIISFFITRIRYANNSFLAETSATAFPIHSVLDQKLFQEQTDAGIENIEFIASAPITSGAFKSVFYTLLFFPTIFFLIIYFQTHPIIHCTLILFDIFSCNSNMHHLLIHSTALYFILILYKALLQIVDTTDKVPASIYCVFWWMTKGRQFLKEVISVITIRERERCGA